MKKLILTLVLINLITIIYAQKTTPVSARIILKGIINVGSVTVNQEYELTNDLNDTNVKYYCKGGSSHIISKNNKQYVITTSLGDLKISASLNGKPFGVTQKYSNTASIFLIGSADNSHIEVNHEYELTTSLKDDKVKYSCAGCKSQIISKNNKYYLLATAGACEIIISANLNGRPLGPPCKYKVALSSKK